MRDISDFSGEGKPNGYYMEYYLSKYGGTLTIYRANSRLMEEAKEQFGEMHILLRILVVTDGVVSVER